MVQPDPTSYSLLALNALLYALLAYQFLRRSKGKGRAYTIEEAFALVSRSLMAALPGLPSGSTLREGLRAVESSGVNVDWGKVHSSLGVYERRRFGSGSEDGGDFSEVLRLVQTLEEVTPR